MVAVIGLAQRAKPTTMTGMARLVFGRLTKAWQGEASDFTPLLAEQIDQRRTSAQVCTETTSCIA